MVRPLANLASLLIKNDPVGVGGETPASKPCFQVDRAELQLMDLPKQDSQGYSLAQVEDTSN